MFQGEEKDLGVGSMGLGVLEAGEDSEGSKDVCWRFGGLKLGRGGSQGAHKGVWCEGVPGAGLGQSLFPAEGMGGCCGEAAGIGAGGWLPVPGGPAVPGDALKRPMLTLGAFSMVSGDSDGNWGLWAFHRG